MINISQRQTATLLIDAENQQQYIENIWKLSGYFGELVVSEAYGDWKGSSLLPWQERFEALEISCIQVNHILKKDDADNRLLLRIGEVYNSHTDSSPLDFVILVSGDKAFIHACEQIRERGIKLIIVGGKNKTYEPLKTACDEFYCVENLEEALRELEKQYPIHPNILRQVSKHLGMMFALNFENPPYTGLNYDVAEKELHERLSNSPVNLGNYPLSEYLKYLGETYEKNGERLLVNPHMLRRMALSMAYESAKQDADLVPLALFSECLLKSASKFSPDFYKAYFHGKKLSEWLATYLDSYEIHEGYVERTPPNKLS